MADISKITDVNGNSYDIKDEAARQGSIYYATCSTAKGTQKKQVTIEAITELYTGLKLRILFTNAQDYNGTPTLQINSLTAKNIRIASGTNAGRYTWVAGEVLDLVYDGTYFIIVNEGRATTTYYGSTKLSSSSTSTSETLAATPKAIDNLARYVATGLAAFSTTETYAVGDRVRYGSYMYECNTAITVAEAWNSAHWTVIDPLLTQIENVKKANEDLIILQSSQPSELDNKLWITEGNSYQIPLMSDLPQPGDNIPSNITWSGDPGSSNDYARADHSHPKPHFSTNTYNDAKAAEVGNYLDHVRAVMALETDSSTYKCIPCWLDQESYNGWPEEVNGTAIVFKLGTNRYFITAQLLNGKTYTNVYNINAWTGWGIVLLDTYMPFKETYSNASGSFTTWAAQTLFPKMKSSDECLIIFAADNYTDWPEQEQGVAKAYRRNYLLCLDAILASGNVYTNIYDSRTGHGWTGWKQTAFVNDSGAWYCKMPDGTLIQWGAITSLSFSSEIMITGTKTLPISFIDTNFIVIASAVSTGNNSYLFRVGANAASVSSFDWSLGSGTSVAISGTNRAFNWIAIGRWKA